MFLVELHGKLSAQLEVKEDILTSNVFSFFKYADRTIFLKAFLHLFSLNITIEEAEKAEFLFWPHYEEGTEPDLVLLVGKYYLLVEAKYYSNFAPETKLSKAQLIREIEGGKLEAKSYNKIFKLLAITADHYYKAEKFKIIPSDFHADFIWTNWQSVTSFIENTLEIKTKLIGRDLSFAMDLLSLLKKKGLRGFQGIDSFMNIPKLLSSQNNVFFNAETAVFRGDFLGFMKTLIYSKKLNLLPEYIFFNNNSFDFSLKDIVLIKNTEKIFFNRS